MRTHQESDVGFAMLNDVSEHDLYSTETSDNICVRDNDSLWRSSRACEIGFPVSDETLTQKKDRNSSPEVYMIARVS